MQQARDRSIVEYVKEPTETIKSDFFSKLHDRVEFDKKYAQVAYIPADTIKLEGDGSDCD